MRMRQRRRQRMRLPLVRVSVTLQQAGALLDGLYDYYKLDGRECVRCSALEHLEQVATKGVHIDGGDTIINDVRVSTIFLGFDHNFRRWRGSDSPPILFETMVFANPDAHPALEPLQERYATYDEAEAGHARYCALVRDNTSPTNQHHEPALPV